MALTQEIKTKAAQLQDQGAWLKLFILIAQFGLELIQYLRERKNKKQDVQDQQKNDRPS
jgi:hypothetical protein